jgi:hypothetical protein
MLAAVVVPKLCVPPHVFEVEVETFDVPQVPFEATVTRPDEATVSETQVYDPDATPELPRLTVVVLFPPPLAAVVVTAPDPTTV